MKNIPEGWTGDTRTDEHRQRTGALADLRPDPANPNRMDADTKASMARSLAEFGDLGMIILNRRTGLLIGGHQRADVLRDGKLKVKDLAKPEPDGTVARGHLEHLGRRYAVRVVDWPEDKAHAALLAANRYGRLGQDDAALLKDLLEQLDCGQETDTGQLLADLTGFDAAERERLALQYHVEDGRDGDKAGASPWDRVGNASDGVMFAFGDIHCRLSPDCYGRFKAACPESDVASWVEGVIRACVAH